MRVDISLHLPAANRTSWAVEFLGNEIVQVDPKSGSVRAYSQEANSYLRTRQNSLKFFGMALAPHLANRDIWLKH